MSQNNPEIAKICPARNVCKQVNKMCSTGCPLFIDLRYQMELSGIPKRHQKYDVSTLPEDTIALAVIQRFATDLSSKIDDGKGLYLFGGTGSGKTTTICAIARTYILEESLKAIRTGSRTKQLVQYVNVPDLLDLIKRGFEDESAQEEAQEILENLRKVPLAIIDDIGAERPSEWARERLLTILGFRYDNVLATFVTSNLTIPELVEPLGQRIKSRIEGMTFPLQYQGPDRRKKL